MSSSEQRSTRISCVVLMGTYFGKRNSKSRAGRHPRVRLDVHIRRGYPAAVGKSTWERAHAAFRGGQEQRGDAMLTRARGRHRKAGSWGPRLATAPDVHSKQVNIHLGSASQ